MIAVRTQLETVLFEFRCLQNATTAERGHCNPIKPSYRRRAE
jgi:hypothetical protein